MVAQAWQVAVSQLGASSPSNDVKVTATNWMGALKAARLELGEEGIVPPGASCAVAPDGTVTVLDAASRRRFTLRVSEEPAPAPAEPAKPAPATPPAAVAAPAGRRKSPLAQTMAMIPEPAPKPLVAKPPAPVSIARADSKPNAHQARAMPATGKQPPAVSAADKPSPAAGKPSPGVPGAARRKNPLAQTVAMIPDEPPRTPATAASRRKSPLAQTVGMIPDEIPLPATAAAAPPPSTRRKSPLAQTVGMIPDEPPASAQAPAAQATAESPKRPRKKFETVAFSVDAARTASREIVISDRPPPPDTGAGGAPPGGVVSNRPTSQPFTPPQMELLFERNEEPTPENPLIYRERAYLIPPKASVMEAEAALRYRLEALRAELSQMPKGKFVSLAIFDHHWKAEPERPPIVVLEWKDWRGEPTVDYPATLLSREPARAGSGASASDRLAVAFEGLQQLEHSESASAALEVVIDILEQVIPSDACSACLYDINTDEIRFVAVSGPGSATRQGTAVSSKKGLIGLALKKDHTATVIGDVQLEPNYEPRADAREGLEPRTMLMRPLVGGGRTLGVLQLINRHDATGYSQDDVNVLNYVADRVGEALVVLRQHRAS